MAGIIKAELNVKAVEFISDESGAGILKKKVKPNFKAFGLKYGKDVKAVGEANLDHDRSTNLWSRTKGTFDVDRGFEVTDKIIILLENNNAQSEDRSGKKRFLDFGEFFICRIFCGKYCLYSLKNVFYSYYLHSFAPKLTKPRLALYWFKYYSIIYA